MRSTQLTLSLITCALFVVLIGCGESDDSSEKEDNPIDTLEVDSATEIIDATVAALESVSESQSFGELSSDSLILDDVSVPVSNGALALLIEDSKPSDENENCGGNGQPFDENGDALTQGDDHYAIKKFYCLLTDKESPDVVLGAIGIMKGFNCIAEKQDGFGYSETGTTVDLKYDDILTHEDAEGCFSKETLDSSVEENGALKVDGTATGYLLGEDEKWTHRIELSGIDDEGEDDELMFFIGEKKVAFRNGDYTASLDFDNGILRFENFDRRNDEGNSTRHTRFLVKGTMNADGSFSKISDLQAIQTNGTDVISVKGKKASGYTYNDYRFMSLEDGEYEGGSWSHQVTACVPSKESCSVEEGIVFENDTDASFLFIGNIKNVNKEIVDDWVESYGPLCFKSVTVALLPDEECSF